MDEGIDVNGNGHEILGDDALHRPVGVPGFKDHLHPHLLADEPEGPGTNGVGFEAIRPNLLIVVPG
jgi:hypothetical protein